MNTTRSQLVFGTSAGESLYVVVLTLYMTLLEKYFVCVSWKTPPLIFMDAQLCGGSHSQTGSLLEYFCLFLSTIVKGRILNLKKDKFQGKFSDRLFTAIRPSL